ncbi:MAG: 39S ribosomal protein L45 [Sterolibacterium sp.]|nr:39S ribosomal protein L45 [Sterolibacterium sp.]
MQRFSLFALILALGLSLSIPDAEARRLGGGASFGMKRNSTLMQRNTTPAPAQPSRQAQQPNQAQPAAASPANAAATAGKRSWLGPIAGLAAGLGLAALFSQLGIGAEMGSLFLMLLIGVGVIFLLRRLGNTGNRNTSRQPLQTATVGAHIPASTATPFASLRPAAVGATTTADPARPARPAIPDNFDDAGFLRQAKLNFIRLQAANDAGNLEDIRAVTTPEVFAEIRLQHQEHASATQQTNVMTLDADLLDVSEENGQQIASVQFSGLIRETADAAPESFTEIWHLVRPQDGRGGWLIAGIEQV